MSTLTMIGALLLVFGLLMLSIRLMAYNRKKYSAEEERSASYQPSGGMKICFLPAFRRHEHVPCPVHYFDFISCGYYCLFQ